MYQTHYTGGNAGKRTEPGPQQSPEEYFRYLLEMSIQQQALLEQLSQILQATAAEISHLQHYSADEVPLSTPCHDAQHLLTKLTPHNDIEAYLHTFKKIPSRRGLAMSGVVFSYRCCQVMLNMPTVYYQTRIRMDELLKAEILARCGLSSTQAAMKFHK